VSEALRPVIGPAYLLYGLLLPIWFGLVGWKLLHLDGEVAATKSSDGPIGNGTRGPKRR
jgi:hypothetical protein